LEKKCPGQTQSGEEGSRFGFCYENGELKRAIEKIESKGVKIAGLHLHNSTKTRMPVIYEAIADTAVDIATEYGLQFKYIDIGGGFFGGLETKPPFSEYINKVSRILKKRFTPFSTTLIVEPGMALIGPAVSYSTSVIDVKKTTRNLFVITNGSRMQIDPLMRKESYFYKLNRINKKRGIGEERKVIDKQVITGYTCMENDRLFVLNNSEEIFVGDQIVYEKVGAYTMSLSPLFIKWFPKVYVKDGNKILKVRDNWEANEYKGRSFLI